MSNKTIKNKKTKNNITKKNKVIDNINTLKKFLAELKKPKSKCSIDSSCITPISKSGQKILICKDSVYKSPHEKQNKKYRIELVNSSTIKIDNFTMNLLIQSVIRTLPVSLQNKIEHYNSICLLDNRYSLESDKHVYSYKNDTFNSLEDYLIKSKNIDIDKVCKWLEQIADILNILYDKLQFHHADCKAAQIFLNKDGKAILGDLDRVSFTLNINKKAYRIRMTHLAYSGIYPYIVSETRLLEKLNLNIIKTENELVGFENKPRKTPDLAIASFISSAAILSRTQANAETIVKKTKHLYKNYKIDLPSDITTIERPFSVKTSGRYVIPLKPPEYSSKLHSQVSLNIVKNNIVLKYHK